MKKICKSFIVIIVLMPVIGMSFFSMVFGGSQNGSDKDNPDLIGNVVVEDGDFGSPYSKAFSINQEFNNDSLGGKHMGMDLSAGYGTDVLAISDAVVFETNNICNPNGGFLGNRCPTGTSSDWGGNFVILKFTYKGIVYYIDYCHLLKATVKAGDHLKKGDKIGEQGNSGNSTGTHLHLEIHTGGMFAGSSKNVVNPRDLINFSK